MSKGRELADYLADILAALTEVDQFIAGMPPPITWDYPRTGLPLSSD